MNDPCGNCEDTRHCGGFSGYEVNRAAAAVAVAAVVVVAVAVAVKLPSCVPYDSGFWVEATYWVGVVCGL